MKAKLLLTASALAVSAVLGLSEPVDAQVVSARTVTACGTPPNTPVVGIDYPVTQDTAAKLCVNATVSVGNVTATNPSVSTTGTAVPGNATFIAGKNPAGNLAGILTDTAGDILANITNTPSVTVSSGNVTTNPQVLTTTNASGNVTTGGTFQTVLASSATRKGCLVVNISAETEYVFFGAGTANLTNTIPVGSNAAVSCNIPTGVLTDAVQLTGNTTGDKWVVNSQ